jgi:monocyte to macrophage differentiation protein
LRGSNGVLGEYMVIIVWSSAFCGICYQIIFHEKYKIMEIIFYLAIGVCPSIVVIEMVDVSGLTELATGGVLYVIGVLFFKSDGTIPFAHAIWHLFVSFGASLHYYAIFKYLINN